MKKQIESKLINVCGEETHTLLVTRVVRKHLSRREIDLLIESQTHNKIIVITTLIGGPYSGSQWTRMEDVCIEELQTIHEFLLTEEGWDSIKSGDRVSLTGEKLKDLMAC